MHKLVIFSFVCILSFTTFSQHTNDSIVHKIYKLNSHDYSLKKKEYDIDTMYYYKADKSFYLRVMPISSYTGAGTASDKIGQNIEAGLSYGVLDLGLAVGKYNFHDTTSFMEAKITMDASQYGIFSNEFTLGCGYVFQAKANLMLEASYTILAQIKGNVGLGFVIGYFDFSGRTSDVSKTMYGMFLRYGLPRSNDGNLMRNRKLKMHRKK